MPGVGEQRTPEGASRLCYAPPCMPEAPLVLHSWAGAGAGLGKFPEVVRWISIERDLVDRAGSTTSNRLATIDSIELGSVRSIDDLKTIWVDLADRPPARPLLIDLGPIEPDRA